MAWQNVCTTRGSILPPTTFNQPLIEDSAWAKPTLFIAADMPPYSEWLSPAIMFLHVCIFLKLGQSYTDILVYFCFLFKYFVTIFKCLSTLVRIVAHERLLSVCQLSKYIQYFVFFSPLLYQEHTTNPLQTKKLDYASFCVPLKPYNPPAKSIFNVYSVCLKHFLNAGKLATQS